MQRIKYDESEILDSFFDKAMLDGMLETKAEQLYPDFDISAPVKNELQDLTVVASHDNRLYGLPGDSGEQMVGKAHPGGGTTLALDTKNKDLAKVETIVERQKAMREVAEGKPTGKLVQAMAALIAKADALDAKGDHALAQELDAEIAKLAEAMSDLDPQPHGSASVSAPEAAPAPDVKVMAERAARIKANNARTIGMLNALRAAEGKPPMAASVQAGIITKEVRDELSRAAPSGYTTWRELFNQIQDKINAAQSAAPVEPGEVHKAPDSPAPASIPDLKVDMSQSKLWPERTPVSPGATGP